MSISAIGFNGNNDWMKKKLLDRQAMQQNGLQQPGQEQIQNQNQVQDLSKTQDIDSANKVSSQMGVQGQQGGQLPPWSDMMNDLGIKMTGSADTDIAAIDAKLTTMKTEATSPADKAEINALSQTFEGMKAQAANMQPPAGPPEQQGNQNQMVGLEQLGDINKLMLVKKKFI